MALTPCHIGATSKYVFYLGAKTNGVSMFILGANDDGAEVGVYFLKSNCKGHSCENKTLKGLKCKKVGRKPYHSVNFVIAHDGFTLCDLVSYNSKVTVANCAVLYSMCLMC
jgi:hypothetical protein